MIWLASYPRSGNSLLTTRLREAGFSAGTVYSEQTKFRNEGMFLKTHEIIQDNRRAIHLIRHPADVACSMSTYLNKPFELCVRDMGKWFGGLPDHWKHWSKRKQAIRVKYEDLYFGRVKVTDLAEKLKVKPDTEPMPILSFGELKRQDRDGAKLDKGKPNRYKTELTEAQKCYFKNVYGWLMEEMQYDFE